MSFSLVVGLLVTAAAQRQEPSPAIVSSAIIVNRNSSGECPTAAQLEASRNVLMEEFKMLIRNKSLSMCGDGVWTEVVKFDLTDSSSYCPQPWTTVTSPFRLCAASSCQDSLIFNVAIPYSRVCGEVIGYATGYPDAYHTSNSSIESSYLDGVSIIHGSPRQHIWSFAAGHGTGGVHKSTFYRCPCDNNVTSTAPEPPRFVRENYFCDGPYNGFLWDGEGCRSECCRFHSPPWFSTSLPVSTSDYIEVRLCTNERVSDERIYVKRMTLLVQ